MRRIHLDLLGGMAGDMFAGAMLDLYPELVEGCDEVVQTVVPDAGIDMVCRPHTDGVFSGRKFDVQLPSNHEDDSHDHRHWRDIRRKIEAAAIHDNVKALAISIFQELARAEALVHATDVEKVAFHEVGAYDSIADILSAAFIIHSLPRTDWSMSAIPAGSGTVPSSHGRLPIPAPAVVSLLQGYQFVDDGISGERVTPTGAAIIKFIKPKQAPVHTISTLCACGVGFGTKVLDGSSNILRALVYEDAVQQPADFEHEQVLILQFEIDDQTPEDMAVALNNLRGLDGVLDVSQGFGIGKKGRQTSMIQILSRPDVRDDVVAACFSETTTLGLRWHIENRTLLRRDQLTTESGNRIKVARRPAGLTAKVEMADLESVTEGYHERQKVRISEEQLSLEMFARKTKL